MILLNEGEQAGFIKELTGVGLDNITYHTEYDVGGLLKAQLKKLMEYLKVRSFVFQPDGESAVVIISCDWEAILKETE